MNSELVEFCNAIESYLDGTASEGEIACLQDGIRADPKLRDVFSVTVYRDEVICHALRTSTVRDDSDFDLAFDNDLDPTHEKMDALAREVMSSVIEQALAERRKHEVEEETNRLLAVQQTEGVHRERFELRREAEPVRRVVVIPKFVIWLSLAAVLGLLAWIGWPGIDQARQQESDIAVNTPEPDRIENRAPIVATLGAVVDAQWVGGPDRDGQLREGQRVTLSRGYAKIDFDSGTSLILEAPARLTLDGVNLVSMERGRLVATVPPSATGFTVLTHDARIVDVGTEFGVETSPHASSYTQVFRGKVYAARSTANDTNPTASALAPVALVGGEALTIDQADTPLGELVEQTGSITHRFARSVQPAALAARAYARAVLADGPVAYWQFEESLRGVVENTVGPRYPARIAGNLSFIPSPTGMAARFNPASGGPGYIFVDDPIEELVGKDSYTIEVWFQADDSNRAVLTLVGLFDTSLPRADSDPIPILLHMEIEGQGSIQNPDEPRFRFLNRNPPGGDGGTNVYHPSGDPGQWVHVVAVKDGPQMRLYIDGALVATETDTDRPFASAPSLVIGDHPAALRRTHQSARDTRPMWGVIDELAIYPHALTADEIRDHAAALRMVYDE